MRVCREKRSTHITNTESRRKRTMIFFSGDLLWRKILINVFNFGCDERCPGTPFLLDEVNTSQRIVTQQVLQQGEGTVYTRYSIRTRLRFNSSCFCFQAERACVFFSRIFSRASTANGSRVHFTFYYDQFLWDWVGHMSVFMRLNLARPRFRLYSVHVASCEGFCGGGGEASRERGCTKM